MDKLFTVVYRDKPDKKPKKSRGPFYLGEDGEVYAMEWHHGCAGSCCDPYSEMSKQYDLKAVFLPRKVGG